MSHADAAVAEPRSASLKLTLPNEMPYLPLAQSFVRGSATQFGFEGPSLSQIELAVEEAVTNVMQHGYDAEESRTFDIICERLPGGIRIIIHETGMPFDPTHIPKYRPGESAGMGVFLMKTMMDECSFHNLGPLGKETHLVKYLAEAPGETTVVEPHPIAEPAAITEKINYSVRLMREEEAIEISRCAYKSHGYTFFDDHIYYPERLVELNRKGDMISAVAVTEGNVFMGHAALLYQYPEDRIAELTFAFVNVEYRGHGALTRLNDFLVTTRKSREFAGVYAYAVANHVFTQKALVRGGFNDIGILLATSPRSWKFKGIPGDPSQRISVVLAFRYMETPRSLTLYPPAHHRDMVAKLYRTLGAEHEFETPALQPPVTGEPKVLSSVNPAEGCAEIFVARYGEGVVQEVRKLLRGFCLQQVAAINLFLNLEDPATFFLTQEFEKLGFFFAGILPCARVGDTLILQYLNNVDLDYSKIAAYSEVAKELLAYIRALDPVSTI
ncbi:MAG: ATP-binding protein [Acidobacteriales bacterium]|nr:ATP-binding protein [Terriglobales bacterium]